MQHNITTIVQDIVNSLNTTVTASFVAGQIVAISDYNGKTQIQFAIKHNIRSGDIITIANATNYSGKYRVIELINSYNIVIDAAYVSESTDIWTLQLNRVEWNFEPTTIKELNQIVEKNQRNSSKAFPIVWLTMNIEQNKTESIVPYDYEIPRLSMVFIWETPKQKGKNSNHIYIPERLDTIVFNIINPYVEEFLEALKADNRINTPTTNKLNENRTMYPRFGWENGAENLINITDAIVLDISDLQINKKQIC